MSLNLDFPIIDQNKWEELIAKALKISSLDEFESKIVQGVQLPSFNHPEEKIKRENPLISHDIGWKIGLSVNINDENAHSSIMNAVQNGAEAIILQGSDVQWSELYEGVFHEMIYNDLAINSSENILSSFIDYSISQNKKLDELTGAFAISFETLKANMASAKKISSFHFFTGDSSSENIPEALVEISSKLKTAIEQAAELDLPVSSIRAEVEVDAHLAVNVAKIRALRIIWANLLKAYKKDFTPLFIKAKTKVAKDINDETALIENTSACINAALGTADLICSFPHPDDNQARLNQNIQHIMKMESYLDKVADPLAGSYAIEKMTNHLAEACWKKIAQN